LLNKQIGAISLIAGTAIGVGMLALPMVLAGLGLIPSVLLMLGLWALVYYTVLMSVELNLQAGKGMAIGALGERFSGPIAKWIGTLSLKLLSYTLLAVYIHGSSSIIQKLLAHTIGQEYAFQSIAMLYAFFIAFILLWPIKWLDYINRLLFLGLLAVIAALIVNLGFATSWQHLPLFPPTVSDFSVWHAAIPVILTSFGFQTISHTVVNYCNRDKQTLKRAFFWGSLIPIIVYVIWICTALTALNYHNPEFYQQLIAGNAEIGDVIRELSRTSHWHIIQLLWWWISILAIVTSVIGVGLGLVDALKEQLNSVSNSDSIRKFIAVIITVLPPYLVALIVPNAFLLLLKFAGMILVVIAILLPIYLLHQAKIKNFFYLELRHRGLWLIASVIGAGIVFCELLNIF